MRFRVGFFMAKRKHMFLISSFPKKAFLLHFALPHPFLELICSLIFSEGFNNGENKCLKFFPFTKRELTHSLSSTWKMKSFDLSMFWDLLERSSNIFRVCKNCSVGQKHWTAKCGKCLFGSNFWMRNGCVMLKLSWLEWFSEIRWTRELEHTHLFKDK